jgi:transposase-like protein
MKPRTVTHYAEEFKESSVKLAVESSQAVSQTARELGIHPATLYSWVRKYYPSDKQTWHHSKYEL